MWASRGLSEALSCSMNASVPELATVPIRLTIGNSRLDLMLKGPEDNVVETQGINSLPVVTSSGQILPTSSLADVVLTSGPTEIRHRERIGRLGFPNG